MVDIALSQPETRNIFRDPCTLAAVLLQCLTQPGLIVRYERGFREGCDGRRLPFFVSVETRWRSRAPRETAWPAMNSRPGSQSLTGR